jgi:hypothetical protein
MEQTIVLKMKPIPDFRLSDAISLQKDKTFHKKFKEGINKIIEKTDYSEYDKLYKLITKKDKNGNEHTGVAFLYKFIWIWCWINSINTNYSCVRILINRVNKLIFTKNGKGLLGRFEYFTYEKFMRSTTMISETDDFLRILDSYRQDIFSPKNSKKEDSIFNEMKYATMFSWFKGKLHEITLINNLSCYFDDVNQIYFSFERGDFNDMLSGEDLIFSRISKNKNTTQIKGDTVILETDDYLIFGNSKYYESYRNVDYFCVVTSDNIYFCNNSKNSSLIGNMFHNELNGTYLTIHKSLLIKNKKEINMSITTVMENLLILSANNKIDFNMVYNPEIKENKIELIEGDEPFILISYNDIEDKDFDKKVINFQSELLLKLEDLKKRFK